VDICLPTHLHYATALAALRAGKHVLVEKPIALDGRSADELVREGKASNRILMAGQVLRFIPAYRGLAEAVASGQYGAVRSALFRRRCAAPAWSKWLGDADKSGGGVFDLLIHDVDFALMVFGVPDAVSATGYEDLPLGMDAIHATLYYENDFSVVITGGWFHKRRIHSRWSLPCPRMAARSSTARNVATVSTFTSVRASGRICRCRVRTRSKRNCGTS
jgi:predicted dehydrogenase